MKFNWGHGITIAIVAFMSFIVYIVIQTFQLNADLIQDDFYEEEIRTDDKKVMAQNYALLTDTIQVQQAEEGVLIIFPEALNKATGRIQFYRADDKRLDRFYDIKLNNKGIQTFAYSEFLTGSYDIKIECAQNDTWYMHQTSIQF